MANYNLDLSRTVEMINTNSITDEVLDELVKVMWDYDPYGIMDEYFDMDEEERTEAIKKELLFEVENEKEQLIDIIKEML